MTKKKNFEASWNALVYRVKSNMPSKKITDVELMSELGYSPPNWKVWKSKFIEKAMITEFLDDQEKRKNVYHVIEYNKKKKVWSYLEFIQEESDSITQELFS